MALFLRLASPSPLVVSPELRAALSEVDPAWRDTENPGLRGLFPLQRWSEAEESAHIVEQRLNQRLHAKGLRVEVRALPEANAEFRPQSAAAPAVDDDAALRLLMSQR